MPKASRADLSYLKSGREPRPKAMSEPAKDEPKGLSTNPQTPKPPSGNLQYSQMAGGRDLSTFMWVSPPEWDVGLVGNTTQGSGVPEPLSQQTCAAAIQLLALGQTK